MRRRTLANAVQPCVDAAEVILDRMIAFGLETKCVKVLNVAFLPARTDRALSFRAFACEHLDVDQGQALLPCLFANASPPENQIAFRSESRLAAGPKLGRHRRFRRTGVSAGFVFALQPPWRGPRAQS